MENHSVQNKVRNHKNQSRTENMPVGTSMKLVVTKVSDKEHKHQSPQFYSTPIFKSKKNGCL